jgi:hypothetical protein
VVPGLNRKIACLSVDVEPDLHCPGGRTRLFEDERRLDALAATLRRHDVPMTCFVVMKHARAYKDALQWLAGTVNLELAVHSYSHDQQAPATAREAVQSWDAYCETWNRAPRGYRSPNCLIDTNGIHNLAAQGFLYDSSVTPSLRLDRYGYSNLHLPTEPFYVQAATRRIIEFPIACLSGVRLPLALSYAKLIGSRAIRAATTLFALPKVLTIYFHPYDLYAADIAGNIPGWKRYAHLRNGNGGLRILEEMVSMIKNRGYDFMLMEEAAKHVEAWELPRLSSLTP